MRIDGQPGLSLATLYAPITEPLQQTRQIIADELISDQGFISDLCRHVEQFHGKMLRPAVLLLTAKACGRLTPAHPVLGAVVEMVHIATLVHDDLLDEADIRRRAATVNRLWGNERAVLMGDFLYSHAYHLCSGLDSQFAARLVGQTAITVCEGEMMQVASRGNFDLTEAEYFEIISRKTASLVEVCCHLGAHYADAGSDTVTQMRHFGRNIGIAFQIVDDLLDLLGDEAEVGKSLGRDLCEGELTLPVIHYLANADNGDREALQGVTRGDGTRCCREVAALLRESDSIEYARAVARHYVSKAQENLDTLPPSVARDSLRTMADFILARRR